MVGEGAGGGDNAMVEVLVLCEGEVGADLVQGPGDALDPRMVPGDAETKQAERYRKARDDIDDDLLARLVGAGQERLARVDPGRAGADDGEAVGAAAPLESRASGAEEAGCSETIDR